MPERSRDWLQQAERDLRRAGLDLEHEYFEWASFVSQQAGEKAVKAVYLANNRSVKGHGILKMLHLLQSEGDFGIGEELLHMARILDRYYIEARYPNGFPTGQPADYFDRQLAQEALHATETILEFSRGHVH